MNDFVCWVFAVIATEALTEIFVDAKITDGIRLFIKKRAFPAIPVEPIESEQSVMISVPLIIPFQQKCWIFAANLSDCGYCVSVWVAGLLALFMPWTYVSKYNIINWLLAALVLHRLSNWLHILFMLVKKGRVRTYDLEMKINHQLDVFHTGMTNGAVGQSVSEASSAIGPQESAEAS